MQKWEKLEDMLMLLAALWDSEIEMNGKTWLDLPAFTLQVKLLCKEEWTKWLLP